MKKKNYNKFCRDKYDDVEVYVWSFISGKFVIIF